MNMGLRCRTIEPRATLVVAQTPWGEDLRLPAKDVRDAAGPFAAGFYGAGRAKGSQWAGGLIERAARRGLRLLGAPYLWGGMSPGGIDCSGLIHLCLGLEGFLVPRDAGDQCRWFRERGLGSPPSGWPPHLSGPGLAFFGETLDTIHHVGFLMEGVMIHASSRVRTTLLDPRSEPEAGKYLDLMRWIVGSDEAAARAG